MLLVIDTVRPSILYAHRYVFVVQPLQLAAWLVAAASHCAPADTSHPYGCLLGGFRGLHTDRGTRGRSMVPDDNYQVVSTVRLAS